jgi:hypothetical protein
MLIFFSQMISKGFSFVVEISFFLQFLFSCSKKIKIVLYFESNIAKYSKDGSTWDIFPTICPSKEKNLSIFLWFYIHTYMCM